MRIAKIIKCEVLIFGFMVTLSGSAFGQSNPMAFDRSVDNPANIEAAMQSQESLDNLVHNLVTQNEILANLNRIAIEPPPITYVLEGGLGRPGDIEIGPHWDTFGYGGAMQQAEALANRALSNLTFFDVNGTTVAVKDESSVLAGLLGEQNHLNTLLMDGAIVQMAPYRVGKSKLYGENNILEIRLKDLNEQTRTLSESIGYDDARRITTGEVSQLQSKLDTIALAVSQLIAYEIDFLKELALKTSSTSAKSTLQAKIAQYKVMKDRVYNVSLVCNRVLRNAHIRDYDPLNPSRRLPPLNGMIQ